MDDVQLSDNNIANIENRVLEEEEDDDEASIVSNNVALRPTPVNDVAHQARQDAHGQSMNKLRKDRGLGASELHVSRYMNRNYGHNHKYEVEDMGAEYDKFVRARNRRDEVNALQSNLDTDQARSRALGISLRELEEFKRYIDRAREKGWEIQNDAEEYEAFVNSDPIHGQLSIGQLSVALGRPVPPAEWRPFIKWINKGRAKGIKTADVKTEYNAYLRNRIEQLGITKGWNTEANMPQYVWDKLLKEYGTDYSSLEQARRSVLVDDSIVGRKDAQARKKGKLDFGKSVIPEPEEDEEFNLFGPELEPAYEPYVPPQQRAAPQKVGINRRELGKGALRPVDADAHHTYIKTGPEDIHDTEAYLDPNFPLENVKVGDANIYTVHRKLADIQNWRKLNEELMVTNPLAYFPELLNAVDTATAGYLENWEGGQPLMFEPDPANPRVRKETEAGREYRLTSLRAIEDIRGVLDRADDSSDQHVQQLQDLFNKTRSDYRDTRKIEDWMQPEYATRAEPAQLKFQNLLLILGLPDPDGPSFQSMVDAAPTKLLQDDMMSYRKEMASRARIPLKDLKTWAERFKLHNPEVKAAIHNLYSKKHKRPRDDTESAEPAAESAEPAEPAAELAPKKAKTKEPKPPKVVPEQPQPNEATMQMIASHIKEVNDNQDRSGGKYLTKFPKHPAIWGMTRDHDKGGIVHPQIKPYLKIKDGKFVTLDDEPVRIVWQKPDPGVTPDKLTYWKIKSWHRVPQTSSSKG